MTASASTTIPASPQQILTYVLDLNRYKLIDRKIARVGQFVGPDDTGRGSVRLWGRVKGLPPAPDKQDFVLVRWSSLTFSGAARQPGRLVFDFTGRFECQRRDGGPTEVTHSYEFTFKGPFRRVERRLAPWLQDEIEQEMADLATALTHHS